MEEELMLKERFGKDAGFRVPEGYFDSFNKQIMESLPGKKHSILVRLRPIAVAASMFGVIAGASLWIGHDEEAKSIAQQTKAIQSEEDYYIFDNDDIYAYLADY